MPSRRMRPPLASPAGFEAGAWASANRQMNDDEHRTGRRVDVDEGLPSVEIPRRILNDLYAHAIETLPEECCGLIIGSDGSSFQRLVRCRNEMTMRHKENPVDYPRDGVDAFFMSHLDYMRALEEAEANAEKVTAVYHSHVGVGAYMSEMDVAYAESDLSPFPHADHIVVAVFDRKVDSVAYFRQDGEGRSFSGCTVVSSE